MYQNVELVSDYGMKEFFLTHFGMKENTGRPGILSCFRVSNESGIYQQTDENLFEYGRVLSISIIEGGYLFTLEDGSWVTMTQ